MKKIIPNEQKCTACRMCELICSFHHLGVFQPSASSIKILRDNIEGVVSINVDLTCDLCENEKAVLCIKNCAYQALSLQQGEKGE